MTVKICVIDLEIPELLSGNSNGAGQRILQKEVCDTCGGLLILKLTDTDSEESGLLFRLLSGMRQQMYLFSLMPWQLPKPGSLYFLSIPCQLSLSYSHPDPLTYSFLHWSAIMTSNRSELTAPRSFPVQAKGTGS